MPQSVARAFNLAPGVSLARCHHERRILARGICFSLFRMPWGLFVAPASCRQLWARCRLEMRSILVRVNGDATLLGG